MKHTHMKIASYFTMGLLAVTIASCSSSETEEKSAVNEEYIDPSSSLNTNFDGKIFSIPSPVLTAMLIKKSSTVFYADLMNPIQNVDKYNTEYSRALNLGIYGADLGYASLYDQKSSTLNYLATVEKLTNALGLEAAFDKQFIQRYENNISNQDSMMIVVSDAFKKADLFLKNGNRKATSSLILTGGWIESMHFACQLSLKKRNNDIIVRIGEQKQTLKTIIEILKEYNKMGNNDKLISQMEDLLVSFEAIKMNYEFAEPETNEASKTTVLKHNISFDISDATLQEITDKLTAIRNSIIA